MNKILKSNKGKIFKGSGPLINKDLMNNNKYGSGTSSVIVENRKEDLMVGSGVVLNNMNNNIKRKPLRLNI